MGPMYFLTIFQYSLKDLNTFSAILIILILWYRLKILSKYTTSLQVITLIILIIIMIAMILIIKRIIIIIVVTIMETILRNNTTKYNNKPHCNR